MMRTPMAPPNPPRGEPADRDPVLEALTALEAALDDNDRRHDQMRARIAVIRQQRAAGRSWRELVSGARRPLIVELLTECRQALDRAGVEVRRVEAQCLHREGMTMDEIARHFGVTRQRVSAILRSSRQAG